MGRVVLLTTFYECVQKLNESDIIHETWVIFDTDSCEKSKHSCGVEGGVYVFALYICLYI